ncbi:MAG: hypothetical protein CMC38_01710 [Flavobacteriaceae bacterium]|nr:hypothetical protein [Flavobacteriaceae bacterium]
MSSEKNIKIFKRSTKIIGVIILLFLCLEGVEYELIQIGKFVVSFILLGLAYLNKDDKILLLLYSGLGVLYFPLLKLNLGADLWLVINISSVIFLVSPFLFSLTRSFSFSWKFFKKEILYTTLALLIIPLSFLIISLHTYFVNEQLNSLKEQAVISKVFENNNLNCIHSIFIFLNTNNLLNIKPSTYTEDSRYKEWIEVLDNNNYAQKRVYQTLKENGIKLSEYEVWDKIVEFENSIDIQKRFRLAFDSYTSKDEYGKKTFRSKGFDFFQETLIEDESFYKLIYLHVFNNFPDVKSRSDFDRRTRPDRGYNKIGSEFVKEYKKVRGKLVDPERFITNNILPYLIVILILRYLFLIGKFLIFHIKNHN